MITQAKQATLAILTALAAALALPTPVYADDTEVFKAQAAQNSNARPKVLIVFDDSGSMSTIVEGQRPAYDPDATYDNKFSSGRIYWSDDGTAPGVGSNNWFNASANRCAQSYDALENEGKVTANRARRWIDSNVIPGSCVDSCPSGTTLRNSGSNGRACYTQECTSTFWGFCTNYEYVFAAPVTSVCEDDTIQVGTWQALSANVKSPPHVECRNDEDDNISDNGVGITSGFPQNNVTTGSEYGPSIDPSMDWGEEAYIFYTPHYLDYLNDDSLIVDRTRLEIAQDVVTGIIDSNPGVDFGLVEMNGNRNTSQNGGRVLKRIIQQMNDGERDNLIDIVNEMEHSGSTPLCESFFEAYRYISGGDVLWGGSTSGSTTNYFGQTWRDDVRSRDMAAETNGTYVSPGSDCAYTYVIVMTDGEPQNDTEANSLIETLTGKTCEDYPTSGQGITKNCLPVLAEYMATTDLDGDASNGDQFAITYTIGFTTDQQLLRDAAELGGGEYKTATSADELAEAFDGLLFTILSVDSTFTAPGVAVDSFNRTQSRDEVFYAMFKPDKAVDWRGNIKKFEVDTIDGRSVIVDKTGAPAFDPLTGAFRETASSFWSTNDGGAVDQGGVGGLLAARDPATRNILTNTGDDGGLVQLNDANVSAADFGMSAGSTFDAVLAWARGYDTSGSPPYDSTRAWVMGDVLHSQPLPVNYGARGAFDEDNPDQRILVGTNSGFIHMFGNDDGQEDWAFFPRELAPILNQRRLNQVSADNVYGVDLTPTVFRQDRNRDGTIDSGDGDTAWGYFGLRRGGRLLYALNISNPDSPSLMWLASPFFTGLGEMGYSWSRPVVARIPGYSDDDGPKPVVIIGAGYDENKDTSDVGTADSFGRGVFILDAVSGKLVRSITPATGTPKNLQESDLLHSVPGEVATLDSNGDELVDRLYFADTGGNVWRVDMGARLPTDAEPEETWFVTRLADLNEGTTATDRRFFNKPDVVRVTLDNEPVDLVLLGSGDRTNPLARDVDNFFYLLRDRQTTNYSSGEPDAGDCDPGVAANLPLDFRCSLPIRQNGLFDITDNVLNTGTDAAVQIATAELSGAAGWKFELLGEGEKSLSDSVTLSGTVVFSTFTPIDIVNNINICEPVSGLGKRYFIDIFSGERDILDLPPGEIPPATPLYVREDGETAILAPPPPEGSNDPNDPPDVDCRGGVCTGFGRHPLPYGNYWYSEDY